MVKGHPPILSDSVPTGKNWVYRYISLMVLIGDVEVLFVLNCVE
jgi:hypothetical protein